MIVPYMEHGANLTVIIIAMLTLSVVQMIIIGPVNFLVLKRKILMFQILFMRWL